MSASFEPKTMKRKNRKDLTIKGPLPPQAPNPSDGDAQIPGSVGNIEGTRTDTLEIGLEFRLDLRSADLVQLKELGFGNGGTVSKVMHATTKVIMARKIIRVDAKENVRKQIVRELQVGHDCSSPYVITFYGAFQNEARDIVLCMEYMDCGSLDRISKEFGPVRVDVLGKITDAMIGGLVYLYEEHRIMHRDIKPSNVLVNSQGMIKLCDFGVATETVNSVANTFVGTSTYMAPERIRGGQAYSIKSDVWSVGLTIMELAIGRFPFDADGSQADARANDGPMGILDLLQQIVHEPAPQLPKSDAFPGILDDFCAKCLLKKADERPTPRELYNHDSFVQAAKRTPVDLRDWAISMMERNNRKSYLAPPAPKSLKSDGTSSDVSYNGSAPSTAATNYSIPDASKTPVTATRQVSPNMSLGGDRSPTHYTTQYGSMQSPIHSIGTAEKSPSNALSLQHLSLETNGDQYHTSKSNRLAYPRDNGQEPASAIEPQGRPMFPPRSSSNNNMPYSTRTPLHNAALPTRPTPPNGPLPIPPQKDFPPYRNPTALAGPPRRQR